MIVFDRAGGGDNRGAGAVAPAEIAVDRVPVEGTDALPRAEDRPADRLVRPGGSGEEIEHPVVRRILDGPDFLDDDVLFSFELIGVKRALGENVADHVQRQTGVDPENAGEIAGPLNPGLRVEVAAHVLDRLGDVAGASAPRALERHVLDEMRQPVLAGALEPCAGGDEYADRRRLQMAGRLGDDGESRGKAAHSDAHAAARAVCRT